MNDLSSKLRLRTVLVIAVAAAGIITLSSLVDGTARPRSAPSHRAAAEQSPQSAAGSALTAGIAKAQERLKTVPGDRDTWAELGLAYVQQARITSDPSYYPKAEGVLKRSLSIGDASDNWHAMAGMGALANARHDFASALTWSRKAQRVDPYDATVFGVQDDALTQLGDYTGADAAVQRMLDLKPGISSFARASYHFEERGRTGNATFAMQRALEQATDPADIAFCRYYLGELAFNSGDPKAALTHYARGLQADPGYDPLVAGRAKAEAALGDSAAATVDYSTVIGRVPQPQYVLEYAELLLSLHRTAQAQQQFALLDTENRLLAAAGVVDDLTMAVVDADHGSAADAVAHARTEWGRRHSVLVADALAWALHRAGANAEALTYAQQANRLGWKNAGFRFHLGMIELALGRRADARRDLQTALDINPYFSLLQAPAARSALASLRRAT